MKRDGVTTLLQIAFLFFSLAATWLDKWDRAIMALLMVILLQLLIIEDMQ